MQYRFHDYTVDPAAREVRQGVQRIALEPKVLQVLLYLLEHRDRVVPKDELLAQCWPATFVSESALTRCLARLRKAVQPTPTAPPVIETRHRQGYRFVAEVTVLAQAPSPAPGDTPPPPVAAPPAPTARPGSPTAERRQLTVLYGDLAEPRTLAAQLDPEDFRDLLEHYHATCTAVLHRYGGSVAQYRRTGLLGYFGWPQAHEEDARRAVHAGLALITALRTLGEAHHQEAGEPLALRIGIHTGLVVVGNAEDDPPSDVLAVGATPQLAEQIQGLAAPETVLISAATYHLVQGYFVCTPREAPRLPGAPAPTILYQVRGPGTAQGRLDLTTPPQRTPFVGREAELAVLRERATRVRQGLGQVVLLRGEAGIGKSRLVQEVTTALVADGFTCIECRGSPYYQHTALYPVVEGLQRLMHGAGDTAAPARLEQLLQQAQLDLTESLPLMAALLGLDLPTHCYPTLQLTPQRQRQRTLETLVALVVGHAARRPVLLIVEDLHWIDPTTLEWLGLMIAQGPTALLLTFLTCRPTFASPWGGLAHVTLLSLPRLVAPQVEQMVHWLGGDALPAAQQRHIVRQTDGVPLFIEEVTKFVLAAQRLHGPPGPQASESVAPEIAIPATLRDSLMARLDQLGPAKGTAQLGATIGREFPAPLLQAVTPLDEEVLRQELHQLVEAELLYQRGVGTTAVYQFKHALIQEAAYASLLRRTRQHYHQHIAQVLEAQFPNTVATQPELLAQHYTAAGLAEQAIAYWQRAGQHASDRSAYLEAISHCTTGIALLQTLPATPEHLQATLTLYIALGAALQMAKGNAAPEVEQAYTQARVLCQQVGETPQLVPVLRGLWRFYIGQPQLRMAREIGDTLLRLAQRAHDPALTVIAHSALGWTWFYLGALPVARLHVEAAMAHDTPDQRRAPAVRIGFDPSVGCRLYAAVIVWFLGYPAQALERLHEALAFARALAHPLSLAFAQWWAAWLAQLRRDVPVVYKEAEAAIALATEQGLTLYEALGTILRGWALAMQGQGEGLAQVRQGIATYRATGAGQAVPLWGILLADVSAYLGYTTEALQTLAEAITLLEQQEERMWEAEAYRLRGAILLRQPEPPQAEAEIWLRRALDIARYQEAKALELRTATSLARLWQQQGKRAEARELLAPVYGWFTEGFETADLQEAKALLDQLA